LYEYEKDIYSPKSGFDCSGLILPAAQICGIPYFCKNTAIIPHTIGSRVTTTRNQVFDNIKTYQDLLDAYCKKGIVKRKDKQEKIRDIFSNLQLFSMQKSWNEKIRQKKEIFTLYEDLPITYKQLTTTTRCWSIVKFFHHDFVYIYAMQQQNQK
jgi:predicted DNA-binding protein YlxM (UPF0122 family)